MSDLDEANDRLQKLMNERDAIAGKCREISSRLQKTRLLIGREQARLRVRSFLESSGLKPVLFIVGPFAALVLPYAIVSATVGGTALSATVAVLSCATIAAALFFGVQYPTTETLRSRSSLARSSVAELNSELEAKTYAMGLIVEAIPKAAAEVEHLEQQQRAFEVAQDFDRLSSLLLNENWRAMRGVEFEQYVARIFEHLGYDTEETAITGDQGVDIIVHAGQRRLAVQTKGYYHSVNNSAVQEAVAGMKFHDCHRSCVVTNSRLTLSAKQLAQANDCIVIEEANFDQFIVGRVLPRYGRAKRITS